jgi:dienelactone hydrolase
MVEHANHIQLYDPFARGQYPVGVRTIEALDTGRHRLFPCEIWYPATAKHAGQDMDAATQDLFTVSSNQTSRRQLAARDAAAQPGKYPLVIFSHPSLQHRRTATFLCAHLSSHGYIVAAMDHSEVVAPELARKNGESEEQKLARWQAMIDSRVPDVRFLLDRLFNNVTWDADIKLDADRIAIVGHSFGGWTALAATDVEPRIKVVVALAPVGAAQRRPGILPATLNFAWGRDVPTLFLVAENDTSLPLGGMREIFARTPATRQMVILRRADHAHFMDNVEELHELVRTMPATAEMAAIQKEMLPIADLCSGDQAQLFVRGLALCHLDATLRELEPARRFLAGDLETELAKRGVDVLLHKD